MKRFIRNLPSIGIVIAIASFAFACSGSASDSASMADSAAQPGPGESPKDNAKAPSGADDDAQPAASDDGGADPKLTALLDRKIVQTASIDVSVEEVSRSFQDVIRIAEAAGGFVASSTFSNGDDAQAADITVRVPADQYQSVLADIRGMGTVDSQGSESNDVTEEYTDLGARMRTLQATEQRYLDLLAQAATIDDILKLQDRLDSVRGEIEQVQGRIELLDHLTELATITVHLRPLSAGGSAGGGLHPLEAAEKAWEASLDALRNVVAVALVIVVFSWWLVIPAVAIAAGARWWTARRPATPA